MRALLLIVVLQWINVACFQPCVYTEAGYLCREIPRDYPADLTSLIIFASALGEINVSMFNSTNLTSVTSLSMTQSGVTAVAPQTFHQFHNLKSLILDNNYVSRVSSGWFSHCGALETLTLSNNKITMLDQNSVYGLTNLLILNLSQNQIHTISGSSFLNVSKLRQLDLSNNNLTRLSVNVLLPLNTTKIRLDGNPWDCSCSEQDFAKFLRGLQNVSLLENEMLVCCNSPPELKGKPVWQEPVCIISTTSHPPEQPATGAPAGSSSTSAGLTTGHPVTERPASINKPLTIGRSTLISLIVVLCALVLVICVLSVLYHRKQQRKYLQVVKPSPENKENVKTGETTGTNNKGERRVKPEQTQTTTTEMLLKTEQTAEGEMMSQIWHIYSSGIYPSRGLMKRVSSAGPVLCWTEVLPKQTDAEAAAEEHDVEKKNEYYGGWMTSEQQNEDVRVNVEDVCEEVEQQKVGEKRADMDEENGSMKNEVSIAMQGSRDDGLTESYVETDKTAKIQTSMEKVPHRGEKNEVTTTEEPLNNELMGDAGSSHATPQGQHSTAQSVENENAENLPYLTIGADPDNQTSKESTAAGRTRPWPVRPIRRVLSWPPTAVQWRKQWVQNQQILNVFPKLIFVTGCRQFQHSFCPATLPAALQFNAPEFLPEDALPQEAGRARIDGDTYLGHAHKFLDFNAQQSMSGKLSPRMGATIISNGETWRSGLKSSTLSGFCSNKSSVDESEVCSVLFSVLHPSVSGSNLKPASGGEINNTDNVEKIQSIKKMRRQVQRSEQITPGLQKQSSRAGQTAARANHCVQRRQVCEDSNVPSSGGSPKDDSLLDLLHEVVENHGRWTRERWRQTQINKHKLKQQGQSH